MVSNAAGGSPGLGCTGAVAADRVGVTGARHGRPSTVSIRPPRGELKKKRRIKILVVSLLSR